MSNASLIRLRYPATCSSCTSELPARTEAWWDRSEKKAFCTGCRPPEPRGEAATLDRGRAGASAEREWKRRKERREERIRTAHPKIGGLILKLTDEPQSTTAWARGSEGEQLLGRFLDALALDNVVVLHDRLIPGTRANIDHVIAAPSGVFVVDAKRYEGKVQKRDVGGLFRTDLRLYVGRRDCTKLVDGMARQDAVRRALTRVSASAVVPTVPVVCFVGAEWGLFTRPMRFGDVNVLWPRALVGLLRANRVLSGEEVRAIARSLAEALPSA